MDGTALILINGLLFIVVLNVWVENNYIVADIPGTGRELGVQYHFAPLAG